MYCYQCGSLNPDAAQRCYRCGADLRAYTDDPNTEIHRLKRELATAQESITRLRRYIPAVVVEGILHDQERLRGERREMAVLFADAVGFTRISASLDAESAFDLINDLLGRLLACVHRYGGLVDKFTGDGLIAVFGAPIAHENNAEMAVRTALEMQKATTEFAPIAREQLGAPLQIRIGIHCGPAIAGILGTEEQAAYTVIGETVNVAARLETEAAPGDIRVSSRIHAQTQSLFTFETPEVLQVKGVDQPIVTYRVVGKRVAPAATRGVPGISTIFLGHEAELAKLKERLKALLQANKGQFVTIRGEAGMGKSRLVTEWLTTVDRHTVNTWQGHGLPYVTGAGYGIFRSLLNNAIRSNPAKARWDDGISPSLIPFLKKILEHPLSAAEELPLATLSPEHSKQLTTLALREWLLKEARKRPLIIILDHFHWADDLSRDAVKTLRDLIYDVPILFCVIARPQTANAFDDVCNDDHHLSIEVGPLTAEQSRMLLAHNVDVTSMPASLVDMILTRAEGNPFYIEEFIRMLIEKELLHLVDGKWHVVSTVALEKLEVPPSLHSLMLARVDRLPENLRNVLRDASIIGPQFDARLLETIEYHFHGTASIAPYLERLTEAELLEPRPQAGPHIYAFRHILTQETIYNSILHSQRPELHRVVAESIIRLYHDDLESYAEALARHYDQARLRDKALHYMILAGNRARARYANREAIEFYSRALQLSQHFDHRESERWAAAIGLADVQHHIGEYEEAIAFYQAALEEWKEALPEAQAEAMLKLARAWTQRGDMEAAETWLHHGLSKLKELAHKFPHIEAEIYAHLGWISLRRGDLRRAQTWLEQALEIVDGTEHYDVLSTILNYLGTTYHNQGDWDRATRAVERALSIREELGDLPGIARSSNSLGILKLNSGNWNGALKDFQRGLRVLEDIGDAEGMAIAHTSIGSVYIDMGTWTEAESHLRQSLMIARQIANPFELAQAHLHFGRLYLVQSQWDQAQQHLDAAISFYKQSGAHTNPGLMMAYWAQGLLNLEQDNVDAAITWEQRMHALLQEINGKPSGKSTEWGHYEQLRGRIALTQGRPDQALNHLKRAEALFLANNTHIEIGRIAHWSAQAWLARGNPQKAKTELLKAHRIFKRLGAVYELERIEKNTRKSREKKP